jgi:hypothetical protein
MREKRIKKHRDTQSKAISHSFLIMGEFKEALKKLEARFTVICGRYSEE